MKTGPETAEPLSPEKFPIHEMLRTSIGIGSGDSLDMEMRVGKDGKKIAMINHPREKGVQYTVVTQGGMLQLIEKNGARLPVAELLQQMWTNNTDRK